MGRIAQSLREYSRLPQIRKRSIEGRGLRRQNTRARYFRDPIGRPPVLHPEIAVRSQDPSLDPAAKSSELPTDRGANPSLEKPLPSPLRRHNRPTGNAQATRLPIRGRFQETIRMLPKGLSTKTERWADLPRSIVIQRPAAEHCWTTSQPSHTTTRSGFPARIRPWRQPKTFTASTQSQTPSSG